MVKFNLDLAIKAALKLKETDPNRYSKLSLSDEEVLAWHSLRDNLKECRDPQTGRYLPDETFTRLEPVDIKTLKPMTVPAIIMFALTVCKGIKLSSRLIRCF